MAISRIVAAVDFSPASRRALENAIELASALGARLDVIHAIEVLTWRGIPYREVMTTGSYEEERRQAASDLEEWADIARERGIDTHTAVIEGDGRSAIPDYARDNDVDLIVLGAKGHSRFGSLLVGSVAITVVQSATCSVELVR